MRHGEVKICDRCGKRVEKFAAREEVCVGGVRDIKAGRGLAWWEVCADCAEDWKRIKAMVDNIPPGE